MSMILNFLSFSLTTCKGVPLMLISFSFDRELAINRLFRPFPLECPVIWTGLACLNHDYRKLCRGSPYTGAYANHYSLCFLKIITPVKCVIPLYDGCIAPPREGELFHRVHERTYQQVWSIDIDRPGVIARGSRLLWDA